ncbi:hypothetical protein ABIF07_000266 [Bradyrhizobium elkanii]|nr:hypothetical protein [Bradyrhizobium elkanii]MCS3695068.1 hypothetical protein [Bradyrhizobium elkanii]
MNIDAGGELSEIIGVFGDDDAVFLNSAREDDVIGIAQPTAIARMDRIVQAVLVEMLAERGRNALVDEELYATDPRWRSTGRPTCGWVFA